MITKKGWDQALMMSLLKKEAAYGNLVTINSSNYVGIKGHSDYNPEWSDEVQTDRDSVTGTEHGTDIDIITQGFKVNITQTRAKPYFVIGMMAAALGSVTTTQDGSYAAYKHRIVPANPGTQLPSFNIVGKKGGIQYRHTGCVVDSIGISMEEGKPVSCNADIIGSGYRISNTASFQPEPSESWMLAKNGYIWYEQDANINIVPNTTLGTQGISSATPDDLKIRVKKADFKWKNNIEGQTGFGSGDTMYQAIDYGRRSAELSLTLRHESSTDLDYYLQKTAFALDMQVKGALIAAGGTMYYGFSLRIPKFKLTKPPLPTGGLDESLTIDLTCEVLDDSVNPAVIFEGYNGIAQFFAA